MGNSKPPQVVDGRVEARSESCPQDAVEQANTKRLALKTGSRMPGVNDPEVSSTKKRKRSESIELPSKRVKRSPPQTPENKYHRPCDWFYTMGSTESGQSSASNLAEDTATNSSSSASRNPRKRRRPDYLETYENGKVAYRKFSPITFDIFKDRESASTPSVADSESDERGFVYDSSDSYDGLANWDWEETSPEEESVATFKNQNNSAGESWSSFHRIGGTGISDVAGSYSRDASGGFHEHLMGLGISSKDTNKASRAFPEKLPDCERDFEFGRRARADVLENDQLTGEEMDAAFELIDRAFAKAEKTRIEQRPQPPKPDGGGYSSSTRTRAADYPGWIVGKEGRPSRLMPPSTVAHFKEEEERAKWAVEAQMVYDRGVFVRGRREETPVLQQPRPQRSLSVVEDFEAWMREER